jgi:hypothetical protein
MHYATDQLQNNSSQVLLVEMDKESLLLNEFTNGNDDDTPLSDGDPKLDFASLSTNSALERLLLQEKRADVCHYLDIPTIMPMIQRRQLVTGDEFMQLLKHWETGARETTVGVLLEILARKHPNWSHLLFKSLQEEGEHKGHVYLVEVLKGSLEKKKNAKVCKQPYDRVHCVQMI